MRKLKFLGLTLVTVCLLLSMPSVFAQPATTISHLKLNIQGTLTIPTQPDLGQIPFTVAAVCLIQQIPHQFGFSFNTAGILKIQLPGSPAIGSINFGAVGFIQLASVGGNFVGNSIFAGQSFQITIDPSGNVFLIDGNSLPFVVNQLSIVNL